MALYILSQGSLTGVPQEFIEHAVAEDLVNGSEPFPSDCQIKKNDNSVGG